MKQIKSNIYSFEPVIKNVSEVLILGSIPGKISLEKRNIMEIKEINFETSSQQY